MVFYLAIRNIFRNKKNNVIIILLIAIITFIFFIGNSVIGMIDRGIRQAFVESLTGDVVLEKTADITMNLFSANTPVIGFYFNIPVLPAYDAVMEIVASRAGINGITSQVSGNAYLDLMNVREPVLLCGIDAESYFSLFPGIILEEGRFLRSGEYGAMITDERAQRIETYSGQRPHIGAPLLLTSGGAMGFKIREVPLVGIYKYKNPGQFMNEIVIIDPQTVRALNSIQVAGVSGRDGYTNTEDGKKFSSLLSADPDDIFGEAFATNDESEAGEFSVDLLENYLRDSKTDRNGRETGGDWNFIILRLKKGVSAGTFISSLNKKIQPYGLTAVNWRTAAGNSAILSLLIQVLFNSGIFLVCVAGVITIINILLITVFRRTREIGTLRAIGASDAYIRSLVFSENLVITLIAAFTGLLGGVLFMFWINTLGINISNELIVSLLGSQILKLDFIPQTAVFSFFIAVLFSLTASLYPVEVTVRIEPIVAVQRG
jgi:ABC-type lipoprotein release transport system permease subunit